MSKPSPGRALRACLPSALLIFLLACAGSRPAAPAASGQPAASQRSLPAAVQALVPEAQRERTVTLFGRAVGPDEVRALQDGAVAYFGFPIELNMISGLHPTKAAEAIQAMKQGAPSGIDVFWTASNVVSILEAGDAFQPVDWTTLGVAPDLKFGQYGLRSYDGSLAMVIYNTSAVPADQAPKTYDQLLDPRWKGRIIMPRDSTPFVYMTHGLGEEKVTQLAQTLVQQQNVSMVPTFPDVRSRVISGEFPLGLGVDVVLDQRKGAPADHAPIDPLIVTPWGFHVMKDAQHPNLAKLLCYWLVTPEGQRTLDEAIGVSLATAEGTAIWKIAQGKQLDVVPHEYMLQEAPRLMRKYTEIMGIR